MREGKIERERKREEEEAQEEMEIKFLLSFSLQTRRYFKLHPASRSSLRRFFFSQGRSKNKRSLFALRKGDKMKSLFCAKVLALAPVVGVELVVENKCIQIACQLGCRVKLVCWIGQ